MYRPRKANTYMDFPKLSSMGIFIYIYIYIYILFYFSDSYLSFVHCPEHLHRLIYHNYGRTIYYECFFDVRALGDVHYPNLKRGILIVTFMRIGCYAYLRNSCSYRDMITCSICCVLTYFLNNLFKK
jgi:hypothetical protein